MKKARATPTPANRRSRKKSAPRSDPGRAKPANLAITVEARLTAELDQLTPAERTLASHLLENYPASGLGTITEIASAAGVSTPTVVRTSKKLGFDGFSDLQRAMRGEVSASLQDPIKKRDAWSNEDNDAHIVNRFADSVSSNVRNTLQRLDRHAFDEAARWLADEDRSLYLTGGRITRSLADHLFNHLQIIRPGVTHLGHSSNIWPQFVVDMNEQSVVVLFDIRRYESELSKLARLSRDRGAQVIVFTDQWGSPIGRLASHRFQALVEAPSAWDSTVAMLLLVEAMISAVQEHRWHESRSRIAELETMFGKTRLFRRFE